MMVDAAVGPEPQPEQLVVMLFDDEWVRNAIVCLSGHDVILQASGRDPARPRAVTRSAQGIVESAVTVSTASETQS